MNRKAIISMALVLILGLGIGFFVAGQMTRKRMSREREFMEDPMKGKTRMMKHMELSAEQKTKVEPIVEEFLLNMRDLHKEYKAERDSLSSKFRESVGKHLTVEQKERLEKRRKRHDKKRRRG